MNEYPEALVEKVAAACFNVEVEPQYDYAYLVRRAATNEGDYAEILRDVRAGAVAALDALGFAPYTGPSYWRSAIHVEGK